MRNGHLVRMAMVVLAAAGLARSSSGGAELPHQAYVWQRLWTPALRQAVAQSAELVEGWRVLAAQSDGRGRLVPVAVDWAALAASGRPVTAVVRIEGQLARLDSDALRADIAALLAGLAEKRVALAGLEIDHDCATGRLAAYADFLERLRPSTPGLALSITALPAWLSSPLLDRALAAADGAVLQVHAVEAPQRGLFDPARAEEWVRAFGRRTKKPFRVALPAYGVRVGYGETGSLASVEGERPLLAGGGDREELIASPADAARFIAAVERDPPPRLAGFVWFRLPTDEDRRAWSLSTLRAVVRGRELTPTLSVEWRRDSGAGAADVVLANRGAVDAPLPERLGVPAGCHVEGLNGYEYWSSRSGPVLRRQEPRILKAGAQAIVGWMRCGANEDKHDPS